MAVALLVAAGSGERLGAGRPKAFVELAGRPMLEWSLDALRAAGIARRSSSRCPHGARRRRAGCIGVPRRGDALGVRARRAGRRAGAGDGRRPRRRAPARDARAVHARARRAGRRRLRDRRRARDRHGQGGRRRPASSTATLDRSRLWAIQTPQAFRRAALERALDVDDDVLAAGHRRRLAGRARGRHRAGRRVLARELQGHHAARPAASPSCCCANDADRLPRPPAPGRPGHTPPRATSPPPTPSATARPPSERGIAELGVAEHIHRFTAALDVWQHPFWRQCAHDDLDDYCGFVREETDLRLGIEADFVPGREDRMANLLDGARVGLRRRLGALPARPRRRHSTTTRHLGRAASRPSASGSATSRRVAESARSGLYDIIGPPRPGQGLGLGARRVPDARPAPLLRAGGRGDRSTPASRSRSPPPGCASRSASIYPARRSSRWLVDAGCPIALSSDAHVPDQLGFGYERRGRAAASRSA